MLSQSAVQVSMQLEIAPQHHLFIIGRGGANLKQIMQHTGAVVHFPDTGSVPAGIVTPNALQASVSSRKSSVIVTGPIESVCLARQHLIVSVAAVV